MSRIASVDGAAAGRPPNTSGRAARITAASKAPGNDDVARPARPRRPIASAKRRPSVVVGKSVVRHGWSLGGWRNTKPEAKRRSVSIWSLGLGTGRSIGST